LPALPDAWREGSVSGLCVRGAFEVGVAWKDGRLTSATVKSKLGGPCRVSYAGKTQEIQLKPGTSRTLDASLRSR
jgi:alpha-L-fucosidase 2